MYLRSSSFHATFCDKFLMPLFAINFDRKGNIVLNHFVFGQGCHLLTDGSIVRVDQNK